MKKNNLVMDMLKIVKYLAIAFVAVIVLAFGFLMTLDVNQYKPEMTELVEKQTGRSFSVDGDLKIVPSLLPTIGVSGVKIGNAKWGSAPEMLQVEQFEAQMSIMPLLKGEIQINRIILNKANILLETNNKGEGNWVLDSKAKDKAESESSSGNLPALNINQVSIKQAKITYKDGQAKTSKELIIDKISLQGKNAESPLAIAIKAKLDELPVQVNGQIGSIQTLTANETFPVDVAISLADVDTKLKGEIAKPLDAKGLNLHLLLNLDSTSKLGSVTGSDVPDYGSLAIDTKLKDNKSGYTLSDLTASLGANTFTGNLSASLGKRPALSGSLSTKLLDLNGLSSSSSNKTEKSDKVFSSDPLPLESLKSADINLTLSADKIISGNNELTATKTTIKLNNGKLSLSPLKTNLIGGKLDGSIVVDASSGKTAALNTNLNIQGIKPDSLPDMKQTLTGAPTDAKINISGSGKSVADIMASANGSILITVGKGTINNKALNVAGADAIFGVLSMLNPGAKKDASSLECGVIKFDIKNGIATTDKGIALSTDKMNVVGSGEINLQTEKLDIGITPDAKGASGLSAAELAGLVRLGGTLANPSPKADTKAALKASLSAGAAVATGGLSLLAQGLLDSGGSDANPCDVALGKVTPKAAVKQEEKKSAVTETVDNVKDKATDAVGGALKKLFGD